MSQTALYPHPFSRAYWRTALLELKNVRTLIFAALMIALRVIFKTISIPIGMDLRINTAYLINAFGAMVFGPVVAIAAASITDTLGCLLFPTGPYFFPFIFQEIAGSLIFALFLYRTDLTAKKVILSRFCINFFVNIVLGTPLMMLYYQMVLGKYYAPFDLMRILKNLVLFPFESVVLILFLDLTVPRLKSLRFQVGSTEKLKLSRKLIPLLCILVITGAVAVGGYCWYAYDHTSLSASYSSEMRLERNTAMQALVQEHHADLSDPVTIIESAYPSLTRRTTSYTVAVYAVDPEALKARAAEGLAEGEDLSDEAYEAAYRTLMGYSKSPAAKDSVLNRLGTAVLVLDEAGTCQSYTDDLAN